MKNKFLTLTSIILLVGICISSCSKDEGTSAPVDHPMVAKLKMNEWMISAQTLNGNDVFSSKDPCEKDDSYVFKADSVCMRNENTIECDPTDPGPFTSEWFFNDDYTELTFDLSDYKILEFTSSILKVQEISGTGAVFISTLEPK